MKENVSKADLSSLSSNSSDLCKKDAKEPAKETKVASPEKPASPKKGSLSSSVEGDNPSPQKQESTTQTKQKRKSSKGSDKNANETKQQNKPGSGKKQQKKKGDKYINLF